MSTDEELFAANLRAMREEVGLTQAGLAKEMADAGYRWHQATVYKVENGDRQIQLGEARHIAHIFNTSLDEMLKDPQGGKVERQLDYDINSFKHACDRLAWSVVDFELRARQALARSVEMAQAIDALGEKVRTARSLLDISAQAAFDIGIRAVDDARIGNNAYSRMAFREKYGLVKDYQPKSLAEHRAEWEGLSNVIAEPPNATDT